MGKVAVTSEGGLVCGRLDGWVSNVIGIVDKQIKEARRWGIGVIESEIKAFQEGQPSIITQVAQAIGGNSVNLRGTSPQAISTRNHWINIWTSLMNKKMKELESWNSLSMLQRSASTDGIWTD